MITKKNMVEKLKNKLSDKGRFVSDILPNKNLTELNCMDLVSFIDHLEIGEKDEINYVFNNLVTVNWLQAIIDSEKIIHKIFFIKLVFTLSYPVIEKKSGERNPHLLKRKLFVAKNMP